MDLHFAPFDRACEVTQLPGDLAVLMVGLAERQGASATARAQAQLWARVDPLGFRPVDGSFHAAMAARMREWGDGVERGMKTPFTEAFQPIFKSAAYRPFTVQNNGAGSPQGSSR